MKISYLELAKYICRNSLDNYETQILLTESYIDSDEWDKARNQIKPLLEHKPFKEVCILMAKIEEEDSGDAQKINAWISRSNFGKLGKVWVCYISGIQQQEWTSLSKSGYFNTLQWKYPKNISEMQSSGLEVNHINYIDN